jgi:hypothetical protein
MESDEFRRQSRDFNELWIREGNNSVLETVARADHFQVVEPLLNAESGMCKWMEKVELQ